MMRCPSLPLPKTTQLGKKRIDSTERELSEMYISTRSMSETITHINNLMNALYNLANWTRDIEDERVPNDIIDYPEVIKSIVRLTDTFEKNAKALSYLYSAEDLQPYFQRVVDAGKGIKWLVTEHNDPGYLRPPIRKLSEYGTYLLEDLINMNDALSKHIATTMPLSGLPTNSLTPAFVTQHSQAALQYAFTLFEDHLRQRIGAGQEVYGESLINEAFGNRGCLTYGATQAEDTGVRNLMSGAYATFRNPYMHRIIGNDDKIVSTILTLIDLLVRLVNDAKDRPSVDSQGAIPIVR